MKTFSAPSPRSGTSGRVAALLATLVLCGGFHPASAQTFPDRPIRFIAPSPPGGGTDSLTRMLANTLGDTARWQLVVENKPGAGGNLGLDIAAKSAPDGYTIAMGESANLAINPYLYRKLPLDPVKDVAPVALIGTVPLVLVVASDRPFDSVASLVAAARARPLVFASSGNGTVGHLVGETWRHAAGIDLLHVPYKGAGPVMTDLIGGQVDLHFASLPAALPLIRSGKLRGLAVTSKERLVSLPSVPTLAEAGFPGFVYHVFYGVVAPAGTDGALIVRLNAEIAKALGTPELQAGLAARGVGIRPGSPQDFAAFLDDERAKWRKAVAESGARVD